MSGPVFAKRDAQPLDQLLAQLPGGEGHKGLDQLIAMIGTPAAPSTFQPSDTVAKFLALMLRQGDGRQVIEWLMDISLRLPYRPTGATIEETALRAARREGINALAEQILAAVQHGQLLLNQHEGKS